ncbi:MAG TPA: flagellar basal body P-ring formation chaperone FlgA, partial [Pseudothermotoga sp.]
CRTIKSGEIIGKEDLLIVQMNVFGKNGQFTDKIDDVVGKMSKKMFKEGEPIDLMYLSKPPDVKTGQVLPATIQIGSVVVTTLVRVVQDGNFGEIIKARNLSTGFLIHGVLKEDYSICVMGS